MFEAKNFDSLIGIKGLSERLIKNHIALYQGYVKNTNLLNDTLKAYLQDGKTGMPEYAELKRRFGWEFNGMRLHELYFENMSNEEPKLEDAGPELSKKITENFGDFDTWKKDFISTGMMRGIGWAALCKDTVSEKLFNIWIDEHNTGNLCGGTILLIMDVFEHAYILDYDIQRTGYINIFFNAINWKTVENRLRA